MAAQVDVQPGEVGRPVTGGRLHLSPLTDSSNKSLIEIPSINQPRIIASEPKKPVPAPKPRLSPKPFTVEKNPTIKPILAPKPQTKPRPESTRLPGYKPEPPSCPKPQQPVASGKPKPGSTNPNRPAPTSFKTSTGQTTKPIVQPFKPAPPLDPIVPSKPTPPVPADRQRPGASGYSKSFTKLPAAEWSGTTQNEDEKAPNEQSKGGTSITRAKSLGFLLDVGQEEGKKEKAPSGSVPLRPQPRASRPRPVSAIFPCSPTLTETPVPAPRWAGRRPLSADLTSKFESIGLSLHRKGPKASTKENTPEEKALQQMQEEDKTPNTMLQTTYAVDNPALPDQSDKKAEEMIVKDTEDDPRGVSIKSRINLFLDSSSSPGASATGQGSDFPFPMQPASETEPPVGIKRLIKQLTEDTTPTQSPVLKPVPKPRPLPLDLTKRFSPERSPELISVSEAADQQEISKDPQRRGEESAVTPNDQTKTFLDLKDSQEQLIKAPTPAGPEAGQPFGATSMERSPAGAVQTVRASLFENVVERHSVFMVDDSKSVNVAKNSLSSPSTKRRDVEDEGTLVTATYKEPGSPSSPFRVLHAFDTVQAVEENRAVSESVPSALWEDKAMTLRSKRSEGNRPGTERTGPVQGQSASTVIAEPQPRYLRVGALPKWISDADQNAGMKKGMTMEPQRERQTASDKDRDQQRVPDQEDVAAAPKRLKMQQAEEHSKPRVTYFALTGQIQETVSLEGPGTNIEGMSVPTDDALAKAALGSSQVKFLPMKGTPPLDEAFAKSSHSKEQVENLMRSDLSPRDIIELEKHRLREKKEREEAEKIRQLALEQEMLRIKELDKEKERQRELRSVLDAQTKEERIDAEQKKELQKETERHMAKIKELEREKQRHLEMEKQALEFARMKELEKQREVERQRQKAFEKQKQEFEEKQRELERQKQMELEKQRLQELEKEKHKELEKERQRQLEREKRREVERMQERERQRERDRQRQREEERQRELDKERRLLEIQKEKQKMEEMERIKEQEKRQLEEFQKQKQKEKERQELIELEKQRLKEKKEREEAEKIRQMALEQEMLRIRELEKERERQKEMERERQREIEREKQRQEQERQQLIELQKQKQKEKERQQLLELEKQRIREKKEREEAEKIKQMALEQEMLRIRELDKERERQKEMEREHQKAIEREKQRELELQRQRDLERERQRQLDIERQEMENQRLRREQEMENQRLRREQEKEKQRMKELERLKEMERRQLLEFEKQKQAERERQQLLELEKRRQREKMEKDEADKMRQIAKQQEAERQRLKEKQRKEELERLRLESSPLRPKVLDLDSVLRMDPLSKASSQRSDPSNRWKEPYKPAILDIDSFTSQAQHVPGKDLFSVSSIQGLESDFGARLQPTPERDITWKTPPQTTGGFSSPVWTASPQDPWEIRSEMPVAQPGTEPKKHANRLSAEQFLLRPDERLSNPVRHWPAQDDPLHLVTSPGTEAKTANAPSGLFSSTPMEQIWLPREPQSQDSRGHIQSQRRSQGSQELNRIRSRSVSRRSAPASTSVEGNLSRVRSRSAHREQDRHSWVPQKHSGEEEEKESETPVRDTDSQYGTWETGLRTDDSLTPATPSSESNLSPSPRKPSPPDTPGDPLSQPEADTPDNVPPTSSSDNQPLAFPDAPVALLDTSALRSRAQLGKKRAPRTRPTRAARQNATPTEGGTTDDWLFRDSTEAKPASKDEDSDSEEQARGGDTGLPVASQPQRVALFPGVDPSALKAQLKKRSDSDNQVNGPAPSPSQLSRSPKSPFLPRAARVLPPTGGKENGEEDSPQWLKELKSKKRLSQYENDS